MAEWKKYRSTFGRLHINVTAHFGVAPANTSDPGLDPNPPHQGGRIMLTRSTDPDPIWDEEGPGGGLPNYKPLKFSEFSLEAFVGGRGGGCASYGVNFCVFLSTNVCFLGLSRCKFSGKIMHEIPKTSRLEKD